MGQGSCWAERPTPVRVSAPPTHALLGTEAEGCPVGQEEHLSPELPQPLPPLNQPIAWPPLRALSTAFWALPWEEQLAALQKGPRILVALDQC